MITKQQYIRLTLVLAIPFSFLGYWLAEDEVILPRHHIIYCQENEEVITCNTIQATLNQILEHNQGYSVVTLSGAELRSGRDGFNHPVTILGGSQIIDADREVFYNPPNTGIAMDLWLPSFGYAGQIYADLSEAHCNIRPINYPDVSWGYSCSGRKLVNGHFHFRNETTNQKFQEGIKTIESIEAKNSTQAIMVLVASFFTPFVAYFMFSLALFLLIKIGRYVIYGQKRSEN